jgi:hypothetical protein
MLDVLLSQGIVAFGEKCAFGPPWDFVVVPALGPRGVCTWRQAGLVTRNVLIIAFLIYLILFNIYCHSGTHCCYFYHHPRPPLAHIRIRISIRHRADRVSPLDLIPYMYRLALDLSNRRTPPGLGRLRCILLMIRHRADWRISLGRIPSIDPPPRGSRVFLPNHAAIQCILPRGRAAFPANGNGVGGVLLPREGGSSPGL